MAAKFSARGFDSSSPTAPDFRALFEAVPGLYLVLSSDLRIVAVSEAYLRATMTERSAILGRGVFEVFPDNPADPNATGVRNLRASLERVLQQRISDAMAVQKYDIRRPASEGSGFEERHWSPVNSPVLGPHGEVVYIIHGVQDVTDYVRLKQKRKEEAQHEQIPARNEQVEAEIFQRGQELQEANQRLRRLNQELEAEIAERKRVGEALELVRGNLETRVQEVMAESLKVNAALQTQMAKGERAELMIREQAEEKKILEEQFLRAQRMESIGSLAGGIAHDLNNALVPVLMGSELLRATGDDRVERERCLELICTSAQRCTQLVKQILSFARGVTGQTGSFQMGHLIAEMVKIGRDTFPKSISVRKQVPNDLWKIEGDTSELNQVLMNLCVNARDAMPQGGQLELSAANVEVSAEEARAHAGVEPGPYVVVGVGDTGSGIAPEVLPRIFEPFFTTKGPDKGTGLGLSTVASIVKRHRGFVQVQTRPAKGTEFRIFLPASQAVQPADVEPKARVLPAGRGEVILLVDDEQSVLGLVKTTLENFGYRVLTATNGLEAIACFEEHKQQIALVLTDKDMPFLDGMGAVDAIRKIKPQIPIIVASGITLDTEELSRMAVHSTLSKPYGVEQLLDGVARALEGTKKTEARESALAGNNRG